LYIAINVIRWSIVVVLTDVLMRIEVECGGRRDRCGISEVGRESGAPNETGILKLYRVYKAFVVDDCALIKWNV